MPDTGSFGDVDPPHQLTTAELFEVWSADIAGWRCTTCDRQGTVGCNIFSGILRCRVCGSFQTRPRVGNHPRP